MKPNIRVILYAAAAALIFLLWQRWQIANAPVPDTAPVQTQTSGSLPPAAQAVNGQAAAAQFVTVKTDVFDITLSENGANIIRAELLNYPVSIKDKSPLALVHENDPNRMIVTSGLVTSNNAGNSPTHFAKWQAAAASYTLENGQDTLQVPFTYTDNNGVMFTKTYTFKRGSYDIGITESVNNQSSQPWQGLAYTQLNYGDGQGPGGIGHVGTYTGAVMSTPDDRYEKISLGDIAKIRVNDTPKTNKYLKQEPTKEGWVAMLQHYFIGAVIPKQGEESTLYTQYDFNNGDHIIGAQTPQRTVAAGENAIVFESSAYVGPKIAKDLEAAAPNLDKTVDYGWLFMISAAMFKVMEFIHSIIGNWGWSIVIMTLLIKLLFFVPSAWAYKSMAKMRALQPEMTRLRERYGDDRAAMSREMMALYKKEGVNPASGCLPMLLQIPFFIAFYYMLAETVELRQAPWVLWIKDLSIMDPYYILPIINAGLMFLQQRLNPPPADPMQQKVMMMLPLVFGFMFLWFPSGLVLYWTVSNAFGIVQQYIMNKRYGSPAQAHKK